MKNLLIGLERAQSEYDTAIRRAEVRIGKRVAFDFSIQWQPSDGFTIVDEHGNVAPLKACLSIIAVRNLTINEFCQILI